MFSVTAHGMAEWRQHARVLIANDIHPHQVAWNDQTPQQSLFGDQLTLDASRPAPNISKQFIALAETVACHRRPERWSLLYHMLWRLLHEDRNLLRISTDPLTHALLQMSQAVRRDAHKAKAFVRFRQTVDEEGQEHYIAWHRPDHFILPMVAPFFSRRFSSMRWTVLTPDQSVSWDGKKLRYGEGVDAATVAEDALEELWRNYYKAIFNPARVSITAMKREMPVRHWATLPEASVIHELLQAAPTRVQKMIDDYEGSLISAADFLPDEDGSVSALRAAAAACQGCDLYRGATQTVFGVGPTDAKLMLVGEQPGDEEDKAGTPFIGPAGEVLNRALGDAGIVRGELYITNAVKHFKFQLKEGARHHRTPSLKEITGCRPWLEAEIAAVKPERIVCLGASAARSLIHPGFTLKEGRGQWTQGNQSTVPVMATYHPSAILRAPPARQQEFYAALVTDLANASRR